MTPIQLTRSVRSLNRLRHIAQVLTKHGFGYVVAQINLTRFVPVWMLGKRASRSEADAVAASIGRRLSQVCSELGPTFIKLGQLASTRPDIVPPDVLEGLRVLQDEVPPFDTPMAMTIIAGELGRPVEACFESIEDAPAASASIGQVYRAKLRTGDEVMVKVRRPGIDETIKVDMQILRWLAESLESLMPELRVYRPVMLVDELDQALNRELDYVNEASTTTRFAEAFKDDPGLRIPKVFWDFTGPRVLTLERLPGVNLSEVMAGRSGPPNRIDRRLVARRLADCYLKQIFEVGAFHADPHPGNVLVAPPAYVGLIDFGQVGTLGGELMSDLVVMVYAVVNGELDVVIDTLADLGALGRDTDRRHLRRALRVLVDKYYGLPLKRLDLGTLLSEFADLMRRNDVVIPRDFSLLIKALGMVGGVTARLDPDLNLLELLGPRLKRAVSERFSPREVARATTLIGWDVLNMLRRAPGQLRQALRRLSTGGWELQVRHENIDRLIKELDRSSNRIAFSVVIAAIIVGSSVVFSTSTSMTLFGLPVQYFGVVGYLLAGLLGLGLSWAIFRSGRLH